MSINDNDKNRVGFWGDNVGPTEPVRKAFGDDAVGATQPVDSANANQRQTFGHPFGAGAENGYQNDSGKTEPVFISGVVGFEPVVGWLVCIDGPERGKDYRIKPGYNSIGSAPSMDISISGDNKISHEKHAMIAYDPDENLFYFGLADGKNLVKQNGKVVMQPSVLHTHDVLTIGSSMFMFTAFCDEAFNWKDE